MDVQEVWLDQEDVQLLKEGEEVTLMDWGNAFVQTISRSEDGKTITGRHVMFERTKIRCSIGKLPLAVWSGFP